MNSRCLFYNVDGVLRNAWLDHYREHSLCFTRDQLNQLNQLFEKKYNGKWMSMTTFEFESEEEKLLFVLTWATPGKR